MITAGVIGGGVGSISGQVFSLRGLLFGSFLAFVAGVRLLLGGVFVLDFVALTAVTAYGTGS